MDTNKATEEKLDQYVLGRMNEAEKADFTKALDQDSSLAEALDLHHQMAQGIKIHARADFRKKLQGFQQQWNTQNEPKVIPLYRRIATWASAAAVLLLLVTATFWMTSAPMSNQDIYSSVYEAYPSMFSSRDAVAGDLPRANEFYQNGQFDQALVIFDQLLEAEPEDARLLLMGGVCLLELDQSEKALTYFQKIIQLKDIYLSDQATWYAALSYLKQDQSAAAIPLLEQLAQQPKADRKKEATALLKLLR
ncbi:MAG: tetratricopeptide repeat protein [Bacteroidota bacterium]